MSPGCEMVPSLTEAAGTLHTGDMQRCDPLMSPAWLSAARPKLFTSVTFLHVRFHLLFLLAYVCFVGVLPRIE